MIIKNTHNIQKNIWRPHKRSQECNKRTQMRSHECNEMTQPQEWDWKNTRNTSKYGNYDPDNYDERSEYDKYEVSEDNKAHNDTYITIDDLNTVEQMNTAKINTDPVTGDLLHKASKRWLTPTNHRYNFKPNQQRETINKPWHRMDNNQPIKTWQNHMHTSWWHKWV